MSGFTGDTLASILGGGIPGAQPKGGLLGGGGGSKGGSGMQGGAPRGRDRNLLREAFGLVTVPARAGVQPVLSGGARGAITPFRGAFNAGDTRGTVNESPLPTMGGSNQLSGRLRRSQLVPSGGPRNDGASAYTGNPKYVYDSSDYIKYKKLRAKNKNYNDSSFGGANNGAKVALARVRN